MVKSRLTRIKKSNYAEKIDRHISPYQSINQIKSIEPYLWGRGAKCKRSCLTWLRTRYCLLHCYVGVLRSESVFHGELSDCCMVTVKRETDPDVMEILIMQMPTGKTVDTGSGKLQYGRAMRHKVASQCAIGALGMYLLFCFHCSGEMDDGVRPDFTNNSSWFDIKILTDGKLSTYTKEMSRKSYTDRVRECFSDLNIISNAYGHWGRVSAPTALELEEIAPEFIRILGTYLCLLQRYY